MRWQAICPECGSRVPRWWFVKRRFRPCMNCSTPIKANERADKKSSRVFGAVFGVPMGVCTPFLLLFVSVRSALLLLISGFAMAIVVGYWMFPYFTPFEQSDPTPKCANCGYDLRATSGRCPECGVIPQKKGIISNRPATNWWGCWNSSEVECQLETSPV
jgi:hypothetical protein